MEDREEEYQNDQGRKVIWVMAETFPFTPIPGDSWEMLRLFIAVEGLTRAVVWGWAGCHILLVGRFCSASSIATGVLSLQMSFGIKIPIA